MTPTRNRPARPGYTLVEILVVMSLIILLAALALGVSQTGMFGSQKVISAGDRASGWLLVAKQRAMRDGQPRGVRFFNTTANPTAFTEAAYIEQPDAWVPNPAQEGNPNGARIVFVYAWTAGTGSPPGPNAVTVSEIYFVGTATDISEYDQRVSNRDSLVLPEFGKAFRIATANAGVTASTYLGPPIVAPAMPTAANVLLVDGVNARRLTLDNPIDLSAAGTQTVGATDHTGAMTTYKFGFQRPPQPLLGEPALQLTGGTSIDFRFGPYTDSSTLPAVMPPYNPTTTTGVSLDTTASFFDILFSPSGQVLNNNAGIVCLWVRETSKAPHPRFDTAGAIDTAASFDQAGAQVLIVLNTRNGLISTQPINPPPANPALGYDPYSFAKDGINSGL